MAPSALGLVIGLAITIGVPAGSLFYASTVALLWEKMQWRERLRPFVAVGRMALSNYLLQSLVCTTLYYSWGIGLYGRVGPLLGFVPTIAIYAAQVVLSVWWLRHFATGPDGMALAPAHLREHCPCGRGCAVATLINP